MADDQQGESEHLGARPRAGCRGNRRLLARILTAGAACAAVLALALPAGAHAGLTDTTAPAGAYLTTMLKVPHGCDGSATTKVEVKIPDGVLSVKPQQVAGWSATTTKRTLDPPAEMHGKKITETVDTVTWVGGPLPDDQMQLFGLTMKLPDERGKTLYFPVVQTCEKGEARWVEIPEKGQPEPEKPASALLLANPEESHGATATASHDSGAEHGKTGSGERAAAASAKPATASGPDSLGIAAIVVAVLALGLAATALLKAGRR